MSVHTYANNGMPQIRLGFSNGFTASVVVTGDGTVALAYWPTFDDEGVDPKRFTDEDRKARAEAVVLGEQEASAEELVEFLMDVSTKAKPAKEEEAS